MPPRLFVGLTCGRLSGVDVFAQSLVRGLRCRGLDVEIVLTDPQSRWSDRQALDSDLPAAPLVRHSAATLAEFLRRRAPCIFLQGYDYTLSRAFIELPSNVGLVLAAHSDDPFYYKHVSRWADWSQAIVAVSPTIAATLAARLTRPAMIEQIPYGVVLPDPRAKRAPGPGGSLDVLYAGRLDHWQKRVLDLPRIVRRAREQGVDVRLTVLGAGDDRSRLAQAASDLVAAGVVRLAGAVSHAEVLAALSRHQALLLPSAFEGLPLVMLEGLARGCVPIISDLASIDASIVRDGVNGFRIAVGDCERFAARLVELARQPGRCQQMAILGPATIVAARLDEKAMLDRYEALLARLWANVEEGTIRRPDLRDAPRPTLGERCPQWLRAAGTRLWQRLRESGEVPSVRHSTMQSGGGGP